MPASEDEVGPFTRDVVHNDRQETIDVLLQVFHESGRNYVVDDLNLEVLDWQLVYVVLPVE